MANGFLFGCVVAIAAFFVLAAVGLPFQNEMAVMECKANYQVTPEDMDLIKDRKLPVSHSGKCMLACILKKMKVMTKRGEFDLRSVNKWLRNKYPNDRANLVYGKMVAEACAKSLPSLNVKDECEMAAEIMSCVRTQGKALKKKAMGKPPTNGGISAGQV